jgi:hypothetical protein
LLLRLTLVILGCWRERQARSIVQDLLLLRRELAESSRFDFTLPSLGRHSTQSIYRTLHSMTAVGRQAAEMGLQVTKILLLIRVQVFPYFHASQRLLLAIGREAIEPLQPLFQLLLPLGRKPAKIRITLQRTTLLIEWLVAMLVQPLA